MQIVERSMITCIIVDVVVVVNVLALGIVNEYNMSGLLQVIFRSPY